MTFNFITRAALLLVLVASVWLARSIQSDNAAYCQGDSDCIAHLEQNTH